MLYSPNFIIFCNFGTKIPIILDLMILDFKLPPTIYLKAQEVVGGNLES